jgi:enoyl-CoA hydratase
MGDELVHLLVADDIATITLDSPDNRNALSAILAQQLHAHLAVASSDASVRAVVLTHTGSTFCAGADLAEMTGGDTAAATASLLQLLRAIVQLPKPVVAKIAGHARAGGIGLIGACDLAFATPAATFAFSEVRLGIAPAVISLTTLGRLSDRAAARYYLTGDVFGAAEGARIGLLTDCTEDLDGTVESILASFRAASPQGLAVTKALLSAPVTAALTERGSHMAGLSARLFASDEAQAAMGAFLHRGK